MEYDLIIVGAGIAGHVLVSKLKNSGKKILVLEAGGDKPSGESQKFYEGKIAATSLPHFPIEKWRTRALGGSSNCWGGGLVPFDPADFLIKDKKGKLLWPVSYEELLPFYDEAKGLLGLATEERTSNLFKPNTHSIFSGNIKLPSFDSRIILRQKGAALNFANDFKNSGVEILLNHQVIDFNISEGVVQDVVVYDHANKIKKNFAGKKIILAAGGLENTRLILATEILKHIPSPDLVGRFYTPHISEPLGLMVRTNTKERVITGYRPFGQNIEGVGFLAPNEEFLKTGILNTKIMFTTEITESWEDFDNIATTAKKNIFRSAFTGDFLQVMIIAEQEPNLESRVYLSDQKGPDNLPTLVLDYRCTEEDFKKIDRVIEVLKEELKKFGFDYYARKVGENTNKLEGASHHLGTLRMAAGPKEGIVDKNLQVFGLSNLFICSGAVFPTPSHANPTFTIGALAARLAKFLG